MSEHGSPHNSTSFEFQHILMFWFLAGVALVLCVPCLTLPVVDEYGSWLVHRAAVEARVDAMRGRVEQQGRIIEALRTDPAVTQRLAGRELGLIPVDHELVQPLDEPEVRLPPWAQPVPVAMPAVIPAPEWLRRLDRWTWRGIFTSRPTREVILAMSGLLLAAALFLYVPRRARQV